ncbi:unnamed protein product [Allacma fusca]|uniref:AAA+ ATPase domain-containing protein n=1 Tax=Allacma fusca TaxID=39272 RepID=A0A8J2P4C3_9HEXA|nr:unnamed protein product [Allacma fusca]
MEVEIPGPSYFEPLNLPGPSTRNKRTDKDDLINESAKKRPRQEDFPSDEEIPEDFDFGDDDDPVIMFNEPIEPEPEPLIIKYRQVLRHMPAIPHVPIATSDGSRLYLRVFPEKSMDTPILEHKKFNLLGVKFHELRKQAEMSKNRFHETLAQVVDTQSLGNGMQEDLWVEKYKPRSYMDLLSEETLNHNLLHWLKLWDRAVFGNDYLAKHKDTKEKYAKLEAKEKEKAENTFGGHRLLQNIVEDGSYDEDGLPKQKIALLYGPPGLGKTTCAHIVAKHAGYKVIELNASDDRSAEIFRRTLDSCTQNRPEVFQDGRPNCLVIDEIDGAPSETVSVLIDLITGKATEKGKKKLKKLLRRPVICICNDLYAVSLRNLRPLAVNLQFPSILPSALVERLKEVSLREDLSMDSVTLHKLAEKTDCDIRSCLSSMQFLKSYNSSGGISNDIFNQIAKKDKNKGIFAVWDEIFKLPLGKKSTSDAEDPTKPTSRFYNILSTVQSFGDYEKLQGGVFENYLKAKFRDSYFQAINEGLRWGQWFEELRHKIEKSQNYALYPYLPMYFVNSHFLYATKNFIKLNYPNAERMKRVTNCKQIIKSQMSDMAPCVGKYLNETTMITDILPSLVNILQPGTIRAIPTQLWNNRERETVNAIVATMIAYNLSYCQQKQEDGTYAFMLEPNVEGIGRFNFQEGLSRPQFPYTVKQLVAREITMEKLRRNDSQNDSFSNSVVDITEIIETPIKPIEKPSPKPANSSFNRHSSSTTLQKSPEPTFQAKDFFGRPIVKSAAKIKADEEKRNVGHIWYKYKEGFSNAVRKNLKIKDFL